MAQVQQAPILAAHLSWLQAEADRWQMITRAPREWVIPQVIGIAIPSGWETTSLQSRPELGCSPLTGIISTGLSILTAPAARALMQPMQDTRPLGGILTSTDSTATFHPETGSDSSITTQASDLKDSKLKSSTCRSKKLPRKIRPKRSPTISPAPYRCLRTRTTTSPMC
uniref:Assembly activating protein n=1 Tax=Pygmy chameleon parvovirus TaxID=1670664 RepID=A0A0G3Z9B0_9VIRU|nr:assembly activating protein [Pygmy chameleon parvovirus]